MNRVLKKNINRVLNRTYRVVKDKRKRARLATLVSKVLVHPKNNLEYDEEFDMYWQKHGDICLQIDQNPIYDFSYKKYEGRINSMFCREYPLNEGDVIVDLGAGVGGELPFYIERIKEAGKVYAVEASMDSFKKLERLCDKNEISQNVSLHHLAISDKEGSVWIEETDLWKANQINEEKVGVEVKAVTLDQFVKEHQIEKIDLFKANIEGAELQVIKGMDESVGMIENFAISCHDFLFEEETHIKETVKAYFEDRGFQVTEIDTGNKYIDSWIFGKRQA